MQTSAGGLAESSLYIWYSDDPLGVVSCQGDCLVPLLFAVDQEWNQVVDDRRAQAGDRVPAGFGFVSIDAHQTVAAGGDVVEGAAVGVALGDVIQGLVDRTQPMPGILVGQGDDPSPLWCAGARAGDKGVMCHPPSNVAFRRVRNVGHSPRLVVVLLQRSLVSGTAVEGAEPPTARCLGRGPGRLGLVCTARARNQVRPTDGSHLRI